MGGGSSKGGDASGSATPQQSGRKASAKTSNKAPIKAYEIIQGVDYSEISGGDEGNIYHEDDMFWELKRGGFVVQVDTEKTKFLQFGMPPETIKMP